jgi:hypothetical protein
VSVELLRPSLHTIDIEPIKSRVSRVCEWLPTQVISWPARKSTSPTYSAPIPAHDHVSTAQLRVIIEAGLRIGKCVRVPVGASRVVIPGRFELSMLPEGRWAILSTGRLLFC